MRLALGQVFERGRNGKRGVGVVTPIEPKLSIGCSVKQGPVAQALHASGPSNVAHGTLAGRLVQAQYPHCGKGRACILDLMRARKGRQRQVQ